MLENNQTKSLNEKPLRLLIGGSPCTHWSIARPNDRETISSGVGWELFENYIIAKEKFKPDLYLYENVVSMDDEIKNEICKVFNKEPYTINGALVSAAERDRYYWSNIENVELPKDKGLVLKDIMEPIIPGKYYYTHPLINVDMTKQVCATMQFNNNEMHKRVFNPDFKVHTLTACNGGHHQKKVMDNGRARKLTPTEYERCMTMPDGYTDCIADTYRYNCLGNGWTAEVIIHILSYIDLPKDYPIEVLSMYDGIATGRYCLDKLGYTNITYKAYEIDKYAIKVALKNYPNIIQNGDAFQVKSDDWAY